MEGKEDDRKEGDSVCGKSLVIFLLFHPFCVELESDHLACGKDA